MTRDFLKALGLEDKAVIDKIMDENGRDITTEKTKYGDYDDVKKQLDTANKQIAEFGKLDYDGVKKSAEDYKAKFEQAQADSKKQLEQLQFDHALETALSGSKAKNIKAVRALLDASSLKLKDGEISGLKEQLEKVKTENDYLFEADEPKPSFTRPGGTPGAQNDDAAIREIMGLPPTTQTT